MKPICDTCNDTHIMPLHNDYDEERQVMCTRCPTPCQKCRAGGNGPFCGETPCSCDCHRENWQYKEHAARKFEKPDDTDCSPTVVLEHIVSPPDEIDVDDVTDSKGVRFIGKATRQPNGEYHCLADVGGALCVVEVSVQRPLYPCR